jgi:hypothetical protein
LHHQPLVDPPPAIAWFALISMRHSATIFGGRAAPQF